MTFILSTEYTDVSISTAKDSAVLVTIKSQENTTGDTNKIMLKQLMDVMNYDEIIETFGNELDEIIKYRNELISF